MTQEKSIDEIRGSLNTFQKMVDAVNFAVSAIGDFEKTEARHRELLSGVDKMVVVVDALKQERADIQAHIDAENSFAEAQIVEIKSRTAKDIDAILAEQAKAEALKADALAALDAEIAKKVASVGTLDASIADKKAEIEKLKAIKNEFVSKINSGA